MRQDQLAHGIIAACRVLREPHVIVFGSQSILGSYNEAQLPETVTRSREMDVGSWRELVGTISPAEVTDAMNLLTVHLGADSAFDFEYGFYVDAVSRESVQLPARWENRVVRFTADIDGQAYGVTGFCLEPHDLCVSKVIAGRPHDNEFVDALIRAELVDTDVLLERLQGEILWTAEYADNKELAVSRAVSHIRYVLRQITENVAQVPSVARTNHQAGPRKRATRRSATRKSTAGNLRTPAARCGAPRKDGLPCQRRGRCPHHQSRA